MTTRVRKLWNDALGAALVATLIGVAILAPKFAFGADIKPNVVIPATNVILNDNVSYQRGEAAVIPYTDNGIAELFIGGDNNKPLQVVDTAALRSQTTNKLSPNRYSIQVGPGVSSPAAGVYEVATTNDLETADVWVRVYPLAGSTITDVTFEHESEMLYDTGGIGDYSDGSRNCWVVTIKDGYAEFTCKNINTDRFGDLIRIKNIECYEINRYQRDHVNDTSVNKFYIKDQLGTYDLYDLRSYLIHYWDGNRGEDWARHDAKRSVNLKGNAILFNGDEKYYMQSAGNTLGLYGGGHTIMEVKGDAADKATSVTNLAVTAIRVLHDTGNVEIDVTFYCKDKTGFDFEDVAVMHCSSLSNGLLDFTSVQYTTTPMSPATTDKGAGIEYHYTFTVAQSAGPDKTGFYRVVYNGIATQVISVVFNSDLKVMGGLYVKGDDGVTYRIKIDGGTITAVAQEAQTQDATE